MIINEETTIQLFAGLKALDKDQRADIYLFNAIALYMHELYDPVIHHLESACLTGQLHVLKYLDADVTEYDNCAIRQAARRGHLHIVRYLHEETNADITADNNYALRHAAFGGYFELVQYIYKQVGQRIPSSDLEQAISQSSSAQIINYLRGLRPRTPGR